MNKLFSRFTTVTRGTQRPKQQESDESEPGAEQALSPKEEVRMERAMTRLARDMGSIDENDPRQLAAVMRRLCDATGEALDTEADEAIRRLETGEDPEKVEQEMAEAFPEEEPGSAYGGAPAYDGGLYDL